MGMNSSIKMAENSAKRCAVLNAYGLRDLFTQDMEDPPGPEKVPGAAADPDAPTAPPRADRVAKESIDALGARWKKCVEPGTANKDNWSKFVCEKANRMFDVWKPLNWTPTDLERVEEALIARGA